MKALLRLEASTRLGAGAAGSDNDLEHLKAHPFFEGVDFKTLSSQKAPIVVRTVRSTLANTSSFQQESSGCPEQTKPKVKNLT